MAGGPEGPVAGGPAAGAGDLAELEARLRRLEQSERVRPKWHADPAILISLAALLFSLTTTAFSYWQAQQAELRAARTEVRQLAQRITVAPREALDLQSQLASDPLAQQNVNAMMTAEVALLANQAREIMAELPPGAVKSNEQLTVGQALVGNYRIAEGMALLHAAVDTADDVLSKTNALRVRGNTQFMLGKPESGRADYQAALREIEKQADRYSRPIVLQNLAFTRMTWAGAEMGLGNFAAARELLTAADADVAQMPDGPLKAATGGQLQQARGMVDGQAAGMGLEAATVMAQP